MEPRLVRWVAAAAVCATGLVGLGSCAPAPEERCTTIGRPGGIMFSSDNVLAIALPPEALDEDTRFCIVKSERTPELFGNAYRVYPNPELHFAAAISYRFALPDDVEEINVGRVDPDAYASGEGEWQSLTDCRVEAEDRQVSCTDDEVAKFYGLLDDYDGPSSDSLADGTTTGGQDTDNPSGPTTNPATTDPVTTDPTTVDTGDTTETDTDPTGRPIDYPPECDDAPVSDFTVVEIGELFAQFGFNEGGAEDMTWDGHGGFIARSSNNLVRLDISGATPGGPVDAFVVEELDAPSFPGTSTLGIRYRSNGDLVMMQANDAVIEVLHFPHSDGSIDEIADLGLPNGLFVDRDDILWYTDFLSGDIIRHDVDADDDSTVANTMAPNGIVYDWRRETVFFVGRTGDANPLLRQRVGRSGAPIGEAVEVTVLEGNSDGLTLDECGNLYVIDQDAGRLERLDLDDMGDLEANDEIVPEIDGNVSNALFAYGDPVWETTLFITGIGGTVFYVDVGRRGEQVPVLAEAPAVLPGDTTSTG